MFENQKILPPLGMVLPEREFANCKAGIGAAYTDKWNAWYHRLAEEEKREYLRLFPEPLLWQGFVSETPECERVHEGDLSVTLWRRNGMPKYTLQEMVNACKPEQEFCFFWQHHPAKNGKISKSCFSQWWQSDFQYDGERFCCMEQCMMLGKAKLFQDHEIQEKIRASTDPKEIKALGRAVRGFDERLWDTVKYPLIVSGNYHKFTQNAELRHFLLSTGDSVLVEASPYDRIWGIGLPADDPRAKDPSQWQGINLLGFALMEVRDEIRRVYTNEALCCDPWEAAL